jgi:hypothetical protein
MSSRYRHLAIFCALPGHVRIHTIRGARARRSTHLFPAYNRPRTEHDIPESFLTIAGAILTALIIIIAVIALAVAVAVASGAVVSN